MCDGDLRFESQVTNPDSQPKSGATIAHAPGVAMTSRIASADGTSLVEAIVATALVATSLAGVAQLFGMAIAANTASQTSTFTTALAAQKVEQLRGERVLTPSPPHALDEDTPGYVDYVDTHGNAVDERNAPGGALYVRRWAVEPLPADSANTVVVQVRVVRGGRPVGADRLPGEARLVTVRTRVPP
jgi:hypothetical protein